jgi:hypothetical protein
MTVSDKLRGSFLNLVRQSNGDFQIGVTASLVAHNWQIDALLDALAHLSPRMRRNAFAVVTAYMQIHEEDEGTSRLFIRMQDLCAERLNIEPDTRMQEHLLLYVIPAVFDNEASAVAALSAYLVSSRANTARYQKIWTFLRDEDWSPD